MCAFGRVPDVELVVDERLQRSLAGHVVGAKGWLEHALLDQGRSSIHESTEQCAMVTASRSGRCPDV